MIVIQYVNEAKKPYSAIILVNLMLTNSDGHVKLIGYGVTEEEARKELNVILDKIMCECGNQK